MPVYTYQAVDARGHKLRGQMPADDEAHLEEKLKITQLWLLDASLLKTRSERDQAAANSKSGSFSRSIKRRDMIEFCTLMAFQCKVGIPLLQALDVCAQDCENPSLKLV